MAKTQTFGDKLKKKKADTGLTVKVIKWYVGGKGTVQTVERFIRVKEIADVDTLDIHNR